MPRERSPAYQHYPTDFALETVGMTTVQVGAYALLRDVCWTEFSIPKDMDRMARICRLSNTSQMEAVWKAIGHLFYEVQGSYFHACIEKERAKQSQWREKSRTGGKRSAESRRSRNTNNLPESQLNLSTPECQPPMNHPSTTLENCGETQPVENSRVVGVWLQPKGNISDFCPSPLTPPHTRSEGGKGRRKSKPTPAPLKEWVPDR